MAYFIGIVVVKQYVTLLDSLMELYWSIKGGWGDTPCICTIGIWAYDNELYGDGCQFIAIDIYGNASNRCEK